VFEESVHVVFDDSNLSVQNSRNECADAEHVVEKSSEETKQ